MGALITVDSLFPIKVLSLPTHLLLGMTLPITFCAKEAYKVVWQAGGKMKFVYLPPGYLNDPGMLRHSAAVVFYQGQCITNDQWILNGRATMSLA